MNDFIEYEENIYHTIPKGQFIEALYVPDVRDLRGLINNNCFVGITINEKYFTCSLGSSSLVAKHLFDQEIKQDFRRGNDMFQDVNDCNYYPTTLLLIMNEFIADNSMKFEIYRPAYIKFTTIAPESSFLSCGCEGNYGCGYFFKIQIDYGFNIEHASLFAVYVKEQLYDNYKIIYSMYSNNTYYVLIKTYDEIYLTHLSYIIDDSDNSASYASYKAHKRVIY